MRKHFQLLSVSLLCMLGFAALSQRSTAQVVLKDRIVEPIEHANMTAVPGSIHPQAQTEFDQGLADNAKVLSALSIHFKRTPAQEASLSALLAAQQDKSSPSYHKWLNQAQFGQRFGMSAADIDKVSSWLQSEGFTITSVAQSRNAINFTGSIANVEKAFQTQIHSYKKDGETHFANATQISVPSALAGSVVGVRGLNDFRIKPRIQFARNRNSDVRQHFTSGVSGVHAIAPGDFALIYDLNPLYTAGFNGAGVNVAVLGQTDIVPSDISDFRAAAGLPVNNPVVFTVPGETPSSVATGSANNDLAETDLDLEWAGAVGTGASITLVNSASVFDSLSYAIENTINGITMPIISQSYGACEAAFATADLTTVEGWLKQANAQGQTVILASGDSAAADCDDNGTANNPIVSAVQGLAVDYPGSSAYVTDLGGTEFMGDGTAAAPQTGAGTYWNANGTSGVADDLITSAKSYIPEMAWNDTTFAIANGGGLSGGGGGVSALWPKPAWQTGVPGIPADGKRDVPDISLASSPDHDAYLYCTQIQTLSSGTNFVSSCQPNSFRISDSGQKDDQGLTQAGGTSFAAPTFAGMLAVIEQQLASGGGLGNINPALYSIAANPNTYSSAFYDITSGSNQVPCTALSPNCPTGANAVIGYTAATGYDLTTGIGSVDASNLDVAFAALVQATGTKTALVVTPGTSVVINEMVTFTATVAPNTLAAAPTGTVTFTIDGVAAAPVSLSGAAPFAAVYQTEFASAGTHSVSATYSGDSAYTASTSANTVLTVAASGTEATTTTVVAAPTSLALGSALTLTATISGNTAGTLTGPVTFTTGGVTIGTVKQVTLGAGNTATATLSVAAATASLGFVPGTDTITAAYGGDTFNAASSGTTTITVTNPSISLAADDITIASPNPGNSATTTVTLTSMGGYAGTATVTASAASLNANYGFGSGQTSSASVAISSGGTGTTTLTITTIAATGNLQKSPGSHFRKTAVRVAAAGGTLAGCLLFLLVPSIRRKRWPVALMMLVFLSVGAGMGCGGGTGGGAPGGTYTVTVSAADSSNASITGSTTFTVTIK